MRKVLFLGPAGSGKTMRTRQLWAELPFLEGQTLVEAAWLAYGSGVCETWDHRVPFRAPHHTISTRGLIGSLAGSIGALRCVPGEAALAHGGCLMLDEVVEFRRSSLEALAAVLQDGSSKLFDGMVLPARPSLLALTADLCPCGRTGTSHACRCTEVQKARWTERLVEYCDLLGVSEVIACHAQQREVA